MKFAICISLILFGLIGVLIGIEIDEMHKNMMHTIIICSIISIINGAIWFHIEDNRISTIIKPMIQKNYPNATNYSIFWGEASFTYNNIKYNADIETDINDETVISVYEKKSDIFDNTPTVLYNIKTKKNIKEIK